MTIFQDVNTSVLVSLHAYKNIKDKSKSFNPSTHVLTFCLACPGGICCPRIFLDPGESSPVPLRPKPYLKTNICLTVI